MWPKYPVMGMGLYGLRKPTHLSLTTMANSVALNTLHILNLPQPFPSSPTGSVFPFASQQHPASLPEHWLSGKYLLVSTPPRPSVACAHTRKNHCEQGVRLHSPLAMLTVSRPEACCSWGEQDCRFPPLAKLSTA